MLEEKDSEKRPLFSHFDQLTSASSTASGTKMRERIAPPPALIVNNILHISAPLPWNI